MERVRCRHGEALSRVVYASESVVYASVTSMLLIFMHVRDKLRCCENAARRRYRKAARIRGDEI